MLITLILLYLLFFTLCHAGMYNPITIIVFFLLHLILSFFFIIFLKGLRKGFTK